MSSGLKGVTEAFSPKLRNPNLTNRLTGVNLGTGQEIFPNTYNSGVLHQINKVLNPGELDTQ
jgi:hypothetical protein